MIPLFLNHITISLCHILKQACRTSLIHGLALMLVLAQILLPSSAYAGLQPNYDTEVWEDPSGKWWNLVVNDQTDAAEDNDWEKNWKLIRECENNVTPPTVNLIKSLLGSFVGAFLTAATSTNLVEGIRIYCPPLMTDVDGTQQGTYFASDELKGKIHFKYNPCAFTVDGLTSGGCVGKAGDERACDPTFKISATAASCETQSLGPDDGEVTLHLVKFKVEDVDDQLCLYAYWSGWQQMTCQYKKPADPPPLPDLACFMPRICKDEDLFTKSKYDHSMTGVVVQCVSGAVGALFNMERMVSSDQFDDTTCLTTSFFQEFQNVLRKTVSAILILYVMIYGMQVALGQQTPRSSDFMMKMITFVLVSYFALGDAWTLFYPMLINMSMGLSGVIMQATSAFGKYCHFPFNQYDPGFESMAIWDTLDCKIFTYITSGTYYPKLLAVGAYSIFGGGLLILLFAVIFMAFLIAIMIQAVSIYLSALIATGILIFVSPLFIPMALFGPTKTYFDNWLEDLIGYLLYPVALFGFIALLLASLDTLYYGEPYDPANSGATSQNVWLTAPMYKCNGDPLSTLYDTSAECSDNCPTTSSCSQTNSPYPRFRYICGYDSQLYDTSDLCSASCVGNCTPKCDESTIGCQLYKAKFETDTDGAIPMVTPGDFDMKKALLSLLKVTGMALLFLAFMNILDTLLAELTGSHKTPIGETGFNAAGFIQGLIGQAKSAAGKKGSAMKKKMGGGGNS